MLILQCHCTLLSNFINGFLHFSLYIIYSDIDLNNLKLQKEEVSKVEWFNKEEINNLLKNNEIVPHYEEYKILSDYLN